MYRRSKRHWCSCMLWWNAHFLHTHCWYWPAQHDNGKSYLLIFHTTLWYPWNRKWTELMRCQALPSTGLTHPSRCTVQHIFFGFFKAEGHDRWAGGSRKGYIWRIQHHACRHWWSTWRCSHVLCLTLQQHHPCYCPFHLLFLPPLQSSSF